MDKTFYKEWFQGFAKGLDELEADSRSCLLKHCAKKCIDTRSIRDISKAS